MVASEELVSNAPLKNADLSAENTSTKQANIYSFTIYILYPKFYLLLYPLYVCQVVVFKASFRHLFQFFVDGLLPGPVKTDIYKAREGEGGPKADSLVENIGITAHTAGKKIVKAIRKGKVREVTDQVVVFKASFRHLFQFFVDGLFSVFLHLLDCLFVLYLLCVNRFERSNDTPRAVC